MAGTLYLVPTPIGNLGDISPRMADTLAQADFIAAEDTRGDSEAPQPSGVEEAYGHLPPAQHRSQRVRRCWTACCRESCALVTDAGMPAISDPGEEMVALCAAARGPGGTHPGSLRPGHGAGSLRPAHRPLHL